MINITGSDQLQFTHASLVRDTAVHYCSSSRSPHLVLGLQVYETSYTTLSFVNFILLLHEFQPFLRYSSSWYLNHCTPHLVPSVLVPHLPQRPKLLCSVSFSLHHLHLVTVPYQKAFPLKGYTGVWLSINSRQALLVFWGNTLESYIKPWIPCSCRMLKEECVARKT